LAILLAVSGVLLVTLGAVPNPLSAWLPTPEPTPISKQAARIEVAYGDLTTASTEVKRRLTVENKGTTTETLHLKIDGYLASESLNLLDDNDEPLSWRPPRSIDLGVFPPKEEKHYQLITYRRSSGFDTEPPFLLQLLNASDQLMDEVFVAPGEQNFRGRVTVITPTSSIQQPKVNISSSVRVNIAGNYRLACCDSDGEIIHDVDRDIKPQSVITFPCPIEIGQAGQWSIKLFPKLSPDHPDKEGPMEKTALITETFEVIPARYTLAFTRTGTFDPDPQKSIVGLRYVVTNTGNLSSGIGINYQPITHAVTTTLIVSDTTWTRPYTLTLVEAKEQQSLLPEKTSLGPGQSVSVEAYVVHDGVLPEFILELAPFLKPDKAIKHQENTQELEIFNK
jgi:hypothetical protein